MADFRAFQPLLLILAVVTGGGAGGILGGHHPHDRSEDNVATIMWSGIRSVVSYPLTGPVTRYPLMTNPGFEAQVALNGFGLAPDPMAVSYRAPITVGEAAGMVLSVAPALGVLGRGAGITSEIGETASIAGESEPLSIEAQFQTNSLQVATDAHDAFWQQVESKNITLNPNLNENLQAGNYVDQQVRAANQALANELGLDANTVQINQRLYAPDGSYRIPDLYFPESGNIIDYSYQLKTTSMPQIRGFQAASPNGTITIVSPAQIRPVYTVGP